MNHLKTLIYSSAASSHRYFLDLSYPALPIWFLSSESFINSNIFSSIASTSIGFTATFNPFTISGKELVSGHITGVPHAIASRTGRPKPSYKLKYRKTLAPLYKRGKSSSDKKPVKITSD